MVDVFSGLEVNLFYTCLHNYDGVVRRVEFKNIGRADNKDAIVLSRASSLTVDYESDASSFYMLQLSGSWGRERSVIETKLTQGVQSFGSTRGVSSHQHNPFCAISTGSPSETTGEVKAFTLIYRYFYFQMIDKAAE
jgi:alpha-galactosidase